MEREQAQELSRLRRQLLVAAVLTALVILSSLAPMLGGPQLPLLPSWFSSPLLRPRLSFGGSISAGNGVAERA
jgi:hypothetical protein